MTVKREDVPAVGRAIYNDMIKDKLGPENKGKLVVIDVNSGDYEICDDDLTATLRLRERHPNAFTWAERVGYPAPYHMDVKISPTGHDKRNSKTACRSTT